MNWRPRTAQEKQDNKKYILRLPQVLEQVNLSRATVYKMIQRSEFPHKFPDRAEETPESFFQSHFSMTGDTRGRSKKYPNELYKLWKELDGKEEYPLEDLVEHCTVADAMEIPENEPGQF